MNTTYHFPTKPDRIRVACLITDLAIGGAEKFITQLALHVNRQRFEIRLFVLRAQPPAVADRYVRQLRESGIQLEFLGLESVWQLPRTWFRMLPALRSFQPHVVQTVLFHANLLGTLAANYLHVPFIFQGVRVAEPNRLRKLVSSYLSRYATGTVYVSESVRCWSEGTAPSNCSRVIPNGIAMAEYATAEPAHLPAQSSIPLILFVGRLHSQKGVDWLLSTLPAVLAAVPHHLLIAGDGPQRLQLMAQVEQLQLSSRIHFLGLRNDIPQLLQRADALLLPSRYEGMPNVVLETMAAGKPVVASRAEGVAELLGPYSEQLTCDFGDSTAWQAKLLWLLQSHEERLLIGQQLQARAREKFSVEQMIIRYEQLWGAAFARES